MDEKAVLFCVVCNDDTLHMVSNEMAGRIKDGIQVKITKCCSCCGKSDEREHTFKWERLSSVKYGQVGQ